jgi:hypothetical protein
MTVMLPWPGLRPQASPLGALNVLRLPQRRTAPQSLAAHFPDVWSQVLSAPQTAAESPGRHTLSLRAGMAELVLLKRLQARTRRELSQDTLERAARIIEVTANSWLGAGAGSPAP